MKTFTYILLNGDNDMYEITSYKYINNNSKITILFLHGWGCNYNYMLPLAKTLNYNCILIDLPGFGENKTFETPQTIYDYSNYIINFLKYKEISIEYIVGHSFGGKIAVLIAKHLNVKALFLLSPSVYNKKRKLDYYIKVYTYKIIKKIRFLKFLLPLFGSKDYKSLSPIMKKTMSNVINESVENNLKELNIPIAIFFGKKDNITPVYIGKKINKTAKDSSLFLLDGDHFAYLNNTTYISNIIESLVDSTC